MKKMIFSLLFIVTAFAASAQVDSLQEYTGKYKFPSGGPVSLVTITVENGTLTANSEAGSSELVRNSGDVFTVVAFNGIATFSRNTDKKIVGVKIEIDDMVLEGTKSESLSVADINRYGLAVYQKR